MRQNCFQLTLSVSGDSRLVAGREMEIEQEKEEGKGGGEEKGDHTNCEEKCTNKCDCEKEKSVGEQDIFGKGLLKRDLDTDIEENRGVRRQKTQDDISTEEEEEKTTSELEEDDDEDDSEDDEDAGPSGTSETSNRAAVNQFSSLMYLWMKTVVDVKPPGMATPIKRTST